MAVAVALTLPIIFLLLALAFDHGFLTSKSLNLQSAADAAALAVAQNMNRPQEELETIALDLVRENGVDVDAADIAVECGFYDELDSYPDFPHYREFARAAEEEMPEGRYANAALVRLRNEVPSLVIRPKGEDRAGVGARSVAYVPHYGLMALGDKGIEINMIWQESYPRLVHCPVHSNGDIKFRGTESFEGDCPVTAVGDVLNYAGTARTVDPVVLTPIDWQAMHDRADHTYYVDDWDDLYEDANAHYGKYEHSLGNKLFVPKPGDHQGRVYYVGYRNLDTPTGLLRLVMNMDWNYTVRPQDWKAYNFTLVVPGHLAIAVYYRYDAGITIGRPDDGNVYIYARGDIFVQDRASTSVAFVFDGVYFRCEDEFNYYTHTRPYMGASPHRWRIVADNIVMRGVFWNEVAMADCAPEFGPWYPALETRLGQATLVESGP